MIMFTAYLIYFFFNDTATTEIYTLSLHDALPISPGPPPAHELERDPRSRALRHGGDCVPHPRRASLRHRRSEEHTSELQSPCNLVCRLLLEKKKTLRHVKELRDTEPLMRLGSIPY